jgi:cortactin
MSGSAKPSSLRAKFEEMAKGNDNAARDRAIEERRKREEREKKELEREEARKRLEEHKLKEETERAAATTPVQVPSPQHIETQPEVEPCREPGAPVVYHQEEVSTPEEPEVSQPPVQSPQPAQPEPEEETEVFTSQDTPAVAASAEEDPDDLGYTAIALYDYQAGKYAHIYTYKTFLPLVFSFRLYSLFSFIDYIQMLNS